MVIDAHVHIHPDTDGMGPGCDASLEHLLSELEASGVDKAVIFAEDVDVPYIKRIENAFVSACCAKHPGRLLGFASVHPLRKEAPGELGHWAGEGGLVGLKLHPRFQNVSAADVRLVPLLKKARELEVPIVVDAFLWKPSPLGVQLPINIDALCKRVPETPVILAHAGGFHFMDALAVAVANDNAYLEIATTLLYFAGTPFEDQFVFALKQVGAQRIIYGSDHPQHSLRETCPKARELLERHGFGDEECEHIFGRTLLSVLPERCRS